VRVTDIRFAPASPDLRATGLRGWASCEVDGEWRFDSLAVRRTKQCRYALAFPTRKDSAGNEHAYYHPLNAAVREQIEAAILGALRDRGYLE